MGSPGDAPAGAGPPRSCGATRDAPSSRMENIYASPAIEILYSAKADELEALRWLRKFSDQHVSFTDCISFALMKRLRIPMAFTFDEHFARAGFRRLPA
jgi:predicted nucleic acid-binding protein